MASGTHFADYCLPLLFDKLESDLVAAKVEALKTLVIAKYFLLLIGTYHLFSINLSIIGAVLPEVQVSSARQLDWSIMDLYSERDFDQRQL